MDNLTLGKDERQEQEVAGRLTLDWDASDQLNFLFKWETGDQDTTGRQNKVGVATPTADFIYRTFGDPNFVASDSYDKRQDGSLPGRPAQYDDSHWDLFSLTATVDIGEYTLKSITGYIDAEVDNALDLDFAPIKLIGQQRRELHEQLTQEFILFSPKDREVEFLVGLFYQDEKLRRAGDLEVYLIALMSGDDRWSVSVLGKNLTDKTVINAPDDIPLGNVGFAGSYFYFLDPPRSYELQFVYRL